MNKESSKNEGFTLVETIVSMVLLSVLVAVCSGFILNGTIITKNLESATKAAALADTLLAKMNSALKYADFVSADSEARSVFFTSLNYGQDAHIYTDKDGYIHIDTILNPVGQVLPSDLYMGYTAALSGISAEAGYFGGYKVKGMLTIRYGESTVRTLEFNIYTGIG